MTRLKSVYGRLCGALQCAALAGALAVGVAPAPALAQGGDATVLDAREALRKKDRVRLAMARATAAAERHPLAMWVDYWELNNRLVDAQQDELNAFAARWSGTYVEDRLRNDWLLELGRRRDWANFAVEYPRFRMNDDRGSAATRCSSIISAARTCARRPWRLGWRSARPTMAAR